ncbi:oligosaccharide repeat unit polymerase [Candidatus Pelagibacter sp.]|nr:oligosaccharide repeat unit polymerase [Candidatus Pelagibacter sp.]
MKSYYNQLIKNFPCILIMLFPLGMVVGPLIGEIIMGLLIILFLSSILRNKDYELFKINFVKLFLIFYLLISINTIVSFVETEQVYKAIAHLRFIIFALAICYFLKQNSKFIKFIFYFTSITLLIVSIDGIYQYIKGENIFGYSRYRVDRISGVFNDDLILGSFISKFLPAILSFYFYVFKKESILNIFYLLFILIVTIFTIFISGERSSMLFILIFCFLLLIFINIKLNYKFISILTFIGLIFITLFNNPVLLNRYYNQTIDHIFGQDVYNKQIIPEYYPLFKTSLKMFNDSLFFGQGFRSFRYKCDNDDFITFGDKYNIINNQVLTFDVSWKILNVQVINLFVSDNDIIKKGDEIFEYKILKGNNQGKTLIFRSNKIGKIGKLSINEGSSFGSGHGISTLDISDLNITKITKARKIGCDTHPHNYYFQLLAETGIIGLFILISIFVFFSIELIKILSKKFILKKTVKNQSEIVLMIFFISYFWPISFTGNFFNNWLSMTLFYSIGIYFFYNKYDKKN